MAAVDARVRAAAPRRPRAGRRGTQAIPAFRGVGRGEPVSVATWIGCGTDIGTILTGPVVPSDVVMWAPGQVLARSAKAGPYSNSPGRPCETMW
jgi:hypothetical protein